MMSEITVDRADSGQTMYPTRTSEAAFDVSQAQVTWLFNCIGTPDSLLYWNEILPQYLRRFPNSEFWTARPPAKLIPGTDKVVECAGSWRIPLGQRAGSYERQIVLPSPLVLRRLRQFPPDLIIVQEVLAYAIYLAILRPFFRSSKILLLLESDPIRDVPSRRNRWVRRIRRFAARRMDWCLTNNESGQAYLEKELGFPSNRIIVKPYLISQPPRVAADKEASVLDSHLPEIARTDRGKTVFLYVGQLVERKGIRQLVEAVSALPQATLKDARFWLVGDGTQRMELEQLVAKRNLQSYVRFLGPQPYDQLAAFYRSASCFVMPTLDDYRALVGFEAISYGLPLLHSRYDGAASELIVEGKNGYVVDPRNTADFSDAMRRMVARRDELPMMGQYSADRSAAYFTLQHAVDNLSSAIGQVLHPSSTN